MAKSRWARVNQRQALALEVEDASTAPPPRAGARDSLLDSKGSVQRLEGIGKVTAVCRLLESTSSRIQLQSQRSPFIFGQRGQVTESLSVSFVICKRRNTVVGTRHFYLYNIQPLLAALRSCSLSSWQYGGGVGWGWL